MIVGSTACSYDDHPCNGSFRVEDPRLSRAHVDAIVRAGARWNGVVGSEHFKIGPRGTCAIFVDDVQSDLHAEYRWRNGEAWIWIHPELLEAPIDRFESVMAHELGHSERLQHVHGPGVMADMDAHTSGFTPLDLEECRQAGLCPSVP